VTAAESDPKFEVLLDHIKRVRGFDFSGYKRTTLTRRIRKRMDMVHISEFVDYIDYLEVHPDEFIHLFNTILINVTSFFRDEQAWRYMSEKVIPDIVQQAGSESIRIWDVGCASGEEAYSIAMAFCEYIGMDTFQDRVKIYATDVDEEALAEARLATYTEQAMENVSEELRSKYFNRTGNRYSFKTEVRRCVIFGRHDLVQDAPISHLDLLVCRNTLMYLNADTQAKILSRFHYALDEDAYLFLGKAETLLSHTGIFQPIDIKNRIFRKVARKTDKIRTMVVRNAELDLNHETNVKEYIRKLSFDATVVPQIVIDAEGKLILANLAARTVFGLKEEDVGRPIQNLEISYRPIELRSLIEKAVLENQSLRVQKVERQIPGQAQYFDVEVCPLISDDKYLGVSVTFTDVTAFHQIHDDLMRANQEYETSNEELSSAHEELETTNEELQSTNEELETTNEEMQSTNEELETMNEELQSTNEELESTANELRQSSFSLNRANSFLNSILASLRSAIIVLDEDLKILVWNDRAEDLWGLRSHEVLGQTLLAIDIGLPVEKLKDPVRKFLKQNAHYDELLLEGVNRRGKPIVCKIRISPLVNSGETATDRGVVISIDEVQSDIDAHLQ
jgi:two-component system, chemotaxis family, CheB/CheR fusion protein